MSALSDEGWDNIGWAPPPELSDDYIPARKNASSIDNWASGDLLNVIDAPTEYMEPDELHHARLAVTARCDDPRMAAELLLMLGLADEAHLSVEPLTEKQPERKKKH